MRDLLVRLGTPAELEQAVKRATPNQQALARKEQQARDQLAKIEKARDRIINLIKQDKITDEQVAKHLHDLAKQEQEVNLILTAERSEFPSLDDKTLQLNIEKVEDAFAVTVLVFDWDGPPADEDSTYSYPRLVSRERLTYENLTRKQRRQLVELVFSPLFQGKPSGVYVITTGGERYGRKTFTYQLRSVLAGVVKSQVHP
jgi:hypothetical protein